MHLFCFSSPRDLYKMTYLGSARKPTWPSRLDRTKDNITTSFSRPWKPSTERISKAGNFSLSCNLISSTCKLYGVITAISDGSISAVHVLLSWFYPDFYSDFLETNFIQILSWFHPDKIRIKSIQNLDKRKWTDLLGINCH